MTAKKPKAKVEKTESATKQVDFVQSTTSGRAVRPYLISEIQVDARQPRAGESPAKTANIATIADGLDVDETGGAHPLQPIVIRPTPAWAPDQTKPYMVKFGECRFLAADKRGAKTIDAELVTVGDEATVFEEQVKENMSRDGLDAAAQMYSVKTFDDRNPNVNAANAGVRLGMPTDTVRGLRKVNTLPSGPRLRFMSGEHTLEVCALLSQIEGATEQERAERQEAASKAVATMDARKAKAHIRGTYFLLLKTAPFDREDATLNPMMGVCSACAFRSGAQATLFASTDEAEDTCTKKSCWDAKVSAALAAKQSASADSTSDTEPKKNASPKKDKIEKPRKEDLQIAAYLARGDIAPEDLEGHCGGMSAEAINEALVRLEAAGNEKAKAALLDRRCEDPSPYSCGSALAIATMAIVAIDEARAKLSPDDFRVFWKKAWPLFAEPGQLEALTQEEEAAPASGTFTHDDLRAEDITPWEDETMPPDEPRDMLCPDGDPS